MLASTTVRKIYISFLRMGGGQSRTPNEALPHNANISPSLCLAWCQSARIRHGDLIFLRTCAPFTIPGRHFAGCTQCIPQNELKICKWTSRIITQHLGVSNLSGALVGPRYPPSRLSNGELVQKRSWRPSYATSFGGTRRLELYSLQRDV